MELSADNVERLLCKFWEHYSDCFYLRKQLPPTLPPPPFPSTLPSLSYTFSILWHYGRKSYLWCIQSAGASEKGKEDRVITKTKVWERLSLIGFFFLLTSVVLNLSSTNICVWTKVRTCKFAQHHLRYRQWKGLNNQDFKKLFKQFSNSSNQTNTLRSFPLLFFTKVLIFLFLKSTVFVQL